VFVIAAIAGECDIQYMDTADHGQQETRQGRSPLRVAIIVGNANTLVDVLGPYQVFLQASLVGGAPYGVDQGRYRVDVVSPTVDLLLTARGGIGLQCTTTIDSLEGEIDTLIVAGASTSAGDAISARISGWLRRHAGAARRVASVCSGAFPLAEAGLLNRRRATTHWRCVDDLAERYPEIYVEPDPIYVRDGNVYTSAGMTSGMDLALALVEEDYGSEVSLGVARSMVIYLRRPGGQAQFSAALRRQTGEDSPIHRDLGIAYRRHRRRNLRRSAGLRAHRRIHPVEGDERIGHKWNTTLGDADIADEERDGRNSDRRFPRRNSALSRSGIPFYNTLKTSLKRGKIGAPEPPAFRMNRGFRHGESSLWGKNLPFGSFFRIHVRCGERVLPAAAELASGTDYRPDLAECSRR
jgi:transcriptional regulator GlxA family with amidase domain